MSRINMAVLLVLGLLLVTAKQSMQMSLRNPIAEIETSNCKVAFLRLGLVLASDNNEKALLDSGLFEPDSENPHVDIAGRRFHVGTLNKTPIMYVKTGTHSVNVAAAVQTLLLKFRTSGIIFFGSSGSLDENMLVPGDVAVPKAVAFTGVWEWKKFRSENKGKLVFGDFNYPVNGENLLGTVEHQKIDMFSTSEEPKEVFWLPISSSWYEAATEELKDLELKKCHSGTCLPGTPKIVFGSKASTSDFYVKNKAYGDFLVEMFNASTADSASGSVALTSLSNEKLFVVFQGVSNVAGGKSTNAGIKYIASYNAFLAATKFINSIPTPRLACE
ncbi:hypothetical protein SADUNF_Sadunf13G0079700 [Salix dunnii]|uniref:Nucleoside phosphorylase domain-containing protein n=1 Tax=Salix dunnii TaxID=1413687 RepID=A0A835JP34_9ROSI|nr:hypothetical protein SADUNF_Sadunf13G0079700 [Salix dunnii]